MTDDITFVAEDTFWINGRGRVFTGRAPVEKANEVLPGKHIRIIGAGAKDCLYRVKGVERYAVPRAMYLGEPTGLLVDETEIPAGAMPA